MASSMKPKPHYVELDKKRPIIFDLNTFDQIEDDFDTTEEAFDAMGEGKMKAVLVILTAALCSADPTNPITRHDAGKLVNMGNMGAVSEALNAAFMAELPEDVRAKIEAAQAKAKAAAEAKAAAKAAGVDVPEDPKAGEAKPASVKG